MFIFGWHPISNSSACNEDNSITDPAQKKWLCNACQPQLSSQNQGLMHMIMFSPPAMPDDSLQAVCKSQYLCFKTVTQLRGRNWVFYYKIFLSQMQKPLQSYSLGSRVEHLRYKDNWPSLPIQQQPWHRQNGLTQQLLSSEGFQSKRIILQ